jgi:hypothetical protein
MLLLPKAPLFEYQRSTGGLWPWITRCTQRLLEREPYPLAEPSVMSSTQPAASSGLEPLAPSSPSSWPAKASPCCS